MFEIEVKAKVDNLPEIARKLSKLGCKISAPIFQYDRIYNEKGKINPRGKKGNVLRIRQQEDKILLTLKKNRTNELDCIEHELEISSVEEMENILLQMGYQLAVEIRKTRQKAKYQNYEICLDEVEGLGTFVEVEKITNEPAEKVQEELFQFLESLGVAKDQRISKGYDTLMLELKS